MNLENVTAELRPRGAWEAADFGARLARRDAAALYRVWFAVTIPLLLVGFAIILLSPFPALGALVYWWFEPVADGPLLHVISRRLFGEKADVGDTLRMAPRLAWRNRIFWLSPYRLHVARSIAMPLTQLEGLKGSARRRRAAVINRKIMNQGVGVTVAYQHLYLALYAGIVLIAYALVPPDYQDTLGASWLRQFWAEDGRFSTALALLVSYCAQSALEPWYVGSGFGLYVNCRTRLEAWDLEIAFRRIAARRAREPARFAACLALALVAIGLLRPDTGLAQKADIEKQRADDAIAADEFVDGRLDSYWRDDEVRPLLDEVMASGQLQLTREIETWRRRDGDEGTPAATPDEPGPLLAAIAGMLARGVELSLWLLAAIAAGWVLLKARRWLPAHRPSPEPKAPPPATALDRGAIAAGSLPGDIPGEALTAAGAGDSRLALSLLYRGSVEAAVDRYDLRLPDSATEGVCLRTIERDTNAIHTAYFRRLLAAWMACAYGSREPDAEAVRQLCAEWRDQYETAR